MTAYKNTVDYLRKLRSRVLTHLAHLGVDDEQQRATQFKLIDEAAEGELRLLESEGYHLKLLSRFSIYLCVVTILLLLAATGIALFTKEISIAAISAAGSTLGQIVNTVLLRQIRQLRKDIYARFPHVIDFCSFAVAARIANIPQVRDGAPEVAKALFEQDS